MQYKILYNLVISIIEIIKHDSNYMYLIITNQNNLNYIAYTVTRENFGYCAHVYSKKKIEWIIHSIYGVKRFHSLSEFHSILTPVEWKLTTQRVKSRPVHLIFTPKEVTDVTTQGVKIEWTECFFCGEYRHWAVADPEGVQQACAPPPPKIGSTMLFKSIYFLLPECLKIRLSRPD